MHGLRSRVTCFVALCVIVGFVAVALGTPPGKTITVVGQDDVGQDRQNIQDAIDSARPGDTVLLEGLFQLDGQRLVIQTSRLTLAGVALDDDGDGETNEDWADGIDNDGDGAVDEDDWNAVLKGVTVGGIPQADDGTNGDLRNRGVSIEGIQGTIRGVEIRDLAFQGFNRTFNVSPDFTTTSKLCSAHTVTGGSAQDIVVRGNLFRNVHRAVQAFGQVRNFTVSDNVVLDLANFQPEPPFLPGPPSGNPIRAFAILTAGGTTACNLPDGSLSFTIEQGNPSRGRIAHNRIKTDAGFGVIVLDTSKTAITDNVIDQGPSTILAAQILGGEGNTLSANRVSGPILGMILSGESPNTLVERNSISETGFVGIFFNPGSSRFAAVNNQFFSPRPGALVDVFLQEGSSRNRVVANDFTTTVIDEGTRNKLVGTLAMIHNPGVPDHVRAKLEDLREELATLTN